jgi:hypothetical protein
VDQSSSIANPIPSLSSPTLTCSVDLNGFNIPAIVLLIWTGPDSFNMSESVQLSESEGSLERTALLSNVTGVNDGIYSCSAQINISPPAELRSFITGDSAMGSDTINITGMLL